MDPKIDKISGCRFYDELPENSQIACKDDFFKDNKPIVGLYYLIHSWHYPVYWLYRVNSNFKYEEHVEPWMGDERVFVKL